MKFYKVSIKSPFGRGQDMVQYAELVLPHISETIFEKVSAILKKIGDPFRIYFSLSMLCTHGDYFIYHFYS